MGRIIHVKDNTSNTWEGKDNAWDDTREDFKYILRPPLINMVVCVFSVGRHPATLETYQSASSRPTRGGFSLLYRNYAKILKPKNPHPEIFPKFSPRTPKIS
jgi:hypothetical protein